MDKLDALYFNLDFCTYLNMSLGMDYKEAEAKARDDVKEVE